MLFGMRGRMAVRNKRSASTNCQSPSLRGAFYCPKSKDIMPMIQNRNQRIVIELHAQTKVGLIYYI